MRKINELEYMYIKPYKSASNPFFPIASKVMKRSRIGEAEALPG